MSRSESEPWAAINATKDKENKYFRYVLWGDKKTIITLANAEKICTLINSENYIQTTFSDLVVLSQEDFNWVLLHCDDIMRPGHIDEEGWDLAPTPIINLLRFTDSNVRKIMLAKPYDFSCLESDAGLSVQEINELSAALVKDLVDNVTVFLTCTELGGGDLSPEVILQLNKSGLEQLSRYSSVRDGVVDPEEVKLYVDTLLKGSSPLKRKTDDHDQDLFESSRLLFSPRRKKEASPEAQEHWDDPFLPLSPSFVAD